MTGQNAVINLWDRLLEFIYLSFAYTSDEVNPGSEVHWVLTVRFCCELMLSFL